MPKPSKDESPSRSSLDDFVQSLRKVAALKASLELDIYTPIAQGQRSLPALLRLTGYNERGLRLLLDSLANIGLLTKTQFEYELTPTADAFLVKGKPTYYGDALLGQMAWEARGQTGKSVRSGKPVTSLMSEGGPRLTDSYFVPMSTTEWKTLVADLTALWDELGLAQAQDPKLRAVAFGAQSALPLIVLAERGSLASLLVIDVPGASESLRLMLQTLEFKVPINYLEGDWLTLDIPNEQFELAVVDSSFTFHSLEQNIGTLHRAWEVLAMEGQIVVHAVIADDERRGPELAPLAGLDALISSLQGDIYTSTEYRGMLEAAGFFDVRPVGQVPDFLVARRRLPPPPPPPSATVAPDFIPPAETRM